MKLLVVGAGLSGAVVARMLAESGFACVVLEQESHPAGNCHASRDAETGIMVHHHGPHIFHSDNQDVWAFVDRFAEFMPYHHDVRSRTGGREYRLPINLDTINAFFNRDMDSDEARAFIEARRVQFSHAPRNFEEAALAAIGPELYGAFFRGYTKKQWGRDPRDIPAKVFARLPLRFNRDNSYFHHSRVAIPREGYTALTAAILDHRDIEVRYACAPDAFRAEQGFAHVIFTGPLDAYFAQRHGPLPYRTLDFETERHAGTFLPTASVNFPEETVPYTRITEHKWFAPWEQHASTIISREYSREAGPGDRLYYPVNLTGNSQRLAAYVADAKASAGVSFVGRLATFKYIDMDVAVALAMNAARDIARLARSGASIPAFLNGEFDEVA